jgi:fructosamine-3-kinase
MTTQRVFNDLKIDKYSVTKYSKDANKILAEAHWMSSLPSELKHFVPTVWNSGMKEDKGFYEIEYFYLSSLADLFVFGNSPLFVWKGILDSCADFLNQTGRYQPEHLEEVAEQSVMLYRSKTQDRLAEYAKTQCISMNREWTINGTHTPSLNEILEEVSIPLDQSQPQFMRIMHGDFCFSNILYDFKSLSIKVLDPRGRDLKGNYSIYGDLRYDVAKLAHSVIGLYDFIIGGLFECRFDRTAYSMELKFPHRSNLEGLQHYFNELHFAGYTVQELSVYPILVHLFLSMLPLHGDHPARQEAMLANALRLYTIYKQQNQ